MSVRSLEDKIEAPGDAPLEMMRRSRIDAYVFPIPANAER